MAKRIDFSELERNTIKLVRALGSNSQVSIVSLTGAQSINACINTINKDIEMQIPLDYEPTKYERIKRFAQKLGLEDCVGLIVKDVSFHEVGHDKLKNDEHGLGCPEDYEHKEKNVETVAITMAEAGRFSTEGAQYLENIISDIINNTNGSRYTRFHGLSMFFAEQAEINGGKFSKLYEAFVKLNMYLWGGRKQKQMLRELYANSKEVDDVVKAVIGEMKLGDNKEANIDVLFDKTKWSETFKIFAKHLVKLMDQSSPELLLGCGRMVYKVPSVFGSKPILNPDEIVDPVLKRILDPENMKKVMDRRNKSGEKPPVYIENWRALDYYYQSRASDIFIKAQTPTTGETLPISPIGARKFDADEDEVEDILFGQILLDDDGKPCLSVPRSHLEIIQQYKQGQKSYPDLCVMLLDNSGSMEEGANAKGKGRTNIVPWGDNSKYHYGALTEYGLEKALHRMGIGLKTRHNLITFGDRTTATGEKSYDERLVRKKKLLNPVFGGDTLIDIDVLRRQVKKGSLFIGISDGEVRNWNYWYKEPVKNDRDEIVKEGIKVKQAYRRIIADTFCVHFQIGSDKQITRDLESWGVTVVKISDAKDMPKKAIDITQKFYRGISQ